MEKANHDLQARLQQVPASELDIEHVTDNDGCVIEMVSYRIWMEM